MEIPDVRGKSLYLDREQFQNLNPDLDLSKLEPFLVDRSFRPFCTDTFILVCAWDTLHFNDAEKIKQALTSL